MKRTLAMFLTLLAVALFVAAGCGESKTTKTNGKTKDGNGKTVEPPAKKEGPAVKKEEPAIKKEEPAVKKEEPAVKKTEAGKLSEKIVGTWEGTMSIADEEQLRADIKSGIEADGGTADDAAIQEEIDAIKAIKITMTFNEDGTALSKAEGIGPEPLEEPGKWEVVEESDKELTLKLTAEGEPDQEMILVFDGDDRFAAADLIPGFTAVFNRKK